MSARVYFYAQTYISAGAGVAPGAPRHCSSEAEAVSEAQRLAGHAQGAAAFQIEGDAAANLWGRPRRIIAFGRSAF